MNFVVDASVVVKWFADEPGSDEARALQRHMLVAPDLLYAEVANVLWRLRRKTLISDEGYVARVEALRNAPIASTPARDLIERAAPLAAEFDHPIYDCLYVALALREGCPLITADRGLQEKASARFGSFVRML